MREIMSVNRNYFVMLKLIFFVSVLLTFVSCDVIDLLQSGCKNKVVEIKDSPNGKYKAYAFIRDCGATTSFIPSVSILKGESMFKNNAGNVFVGYKSRFVKIKWIDDISLEVTYDCKKEDISLQKDKFIGLNIKYVKIK